MFPVYLFLGVVVIIINIVISALFQEVAAYKGFDEMKYFWVCFFLGIAGYLLVIALPNVSNNAVSNSVNCSSPSNLSD